MLGVAPLAEMQQWQPAPRQTPRPNSQWQGGGVGHGMFDQQKVGI